MEFKRLSTKPTKTIEGQTQAKLMMMKKKKKKLEMGQSPV